MLVLTSNARLLRINVASGELLRDVGCQSSGRAAVHIGFQVIGIHHGTPGSLALSPNELYIATCASDGFIKVDSVQHSHIIAEQYCHVRFGMQLFRIAATTRPSLARRVPYTAPCLALTENRCCGLCSESSVTLPFMPCMMPVAAMQLLIGSTGGCTGQTDRKSSAPDRVLLSKYMQNHSGMHPITPCTVLSALR